MSPSDTQRPAELPSWLSVRGADLVLRVRVQPRASHEGVDGVHDGRLRLRVSAPPVEGAANTRVVRLLAELLDLPGGKISVMRGAKAREKDVLIQGQAPQAATLAARLGS